jgi:dTDP-4-dehydrorhamnose reductase
MLATDLAALAPADVQLVQLGLAELDITDAGAVASELDGIHPDIVINAAAYTQVDRAETDYETALAVNGTAVTALGTLCAARDVRVVHFSTDYVFGGDAVRPYREDDSVNPVNAYGRSKLAGELGLAASGARAVILRTQWLFGLHGQSFPRTMWTRAKRRLATRVVADQVGRPTSTVDLARATWDLVGRGASGLYHVANRGSAATWFDVALAVFSAVGSVDCLEPCGTAEYPTPAPRPAYSVLATDLVARDYGVAMQPWRDALRVFVGLLERERES